MAGMISFRRGNGLMNTGFGDFHSMFDDFFADSFQLGRSLEADTFKLDIQDTDKEYIVEAEMPGVDKSKVQLSLNNETLNISVYNEEESEEDKDNKKYIHRERTMTSMTRKIYLPNSEGEGIKAKMENGILQITIPKKVNNSKNIEIE